MSQCHRIKVVLCRYVSGNEAYITLYALETIPLLAGVVLLLPLWWQKHRHHPMVVIDKAHG